MSYQTVTPEFYQMFTPGTPWHAGAEGWSVAPVPGWGDNPNLVGPPLLAVEGLGAYYKNQFTRPIAGLGAYYKNQFTRPIAGLGCGCAQPVRGLGEVTNGQAFVFAVAAFMAGAVLGVAAVEHKYGGRL